MNSEATRLLATLAEKGEYIFTYEQAYAVAKKLGLNKIQLKRLLTKLVSEEWLWHLKKGLYAGIAKIPGFYHIPPFAIGCKLYEPSAVSHLSALHHHGFTEQLPIITMLTTTKRVTVSSIRRKRAGTSDKERHIVSCGNKFLYRTVSQQHFFGHSEIWLDEHFKILITDPERTILDAFVDPAWIGGFGEAMGLLDNAIDRLSIPKLIDYLLCYGQGAIIKRLGWALDSLGVPLEQLKALQEFRVQYYHLLDKTKEATGLYNRVWQVRENHKL
jgi:predicted transcriptional regulator of viral defense system